MELPSIIQGGMGVAVSSWRLARAVSELGHLGVVSSTGLDAVVARRLQLGDPEGHLRAAFEAFPRPEISEKVWARYYVPGGKRQGAPFKSKPMPSLRPAEALNDLMVVANFCEVFLAKRGHSGLVGVNLLEKIQLAALPSLYGAMLAEVDVVLVGAGIPRHIPGVLDALAAGETAHLPIDVHGAPEGTEYTSTFDPRRYFDGPLPRPRFLAIISSAALALTLARKSSGRVDGFVIEGDSAGGHNAPPRGAIQLNEAGEPVYGPRDTPDLEQMRALGLPFYLAGSYGRPGRLKEALALGAQGVQVGTAFAFCDESGLLPSIKRQVISQSLSGGAHAFTDPHASPTGFPFKVVSVEGTLSEPDVYSDRERLCDLGYLREVYAAPDGKVGYRCPAEPVDDYVKKGGDPAATEGRKCLCNSLLATVGLGQVRKDGTPEPPIVTAGRDVALLSEFLVPGQDRYSASDVIEAILR